MNVAAWWNIGIVMVGIGVFGLLARGELLSRLISIEVAFNGAALCALAAMTARGDLGGGTLILFAMGVTVSEVALALAIWVSGVREGAPSNPDDSRTLAQQEDA